MQKLADVLFPSCCPVFEDLCTHLDDAALVNLTKSTSRRVVASAMREIARRPVFAVLQEISENGGWRCCDTMYDVCETGSVWGVQLIIQHGANNWNWGLWGACCGGHGDLAELMIQKGATNWNDGLWGACRGGHRDLADLMIQNGADDWNDGLCGACVRGHRDLAELMIQKGANDWNGGLGHACYWGHRDLAELMIQHGAFVCDSIGCPGHEFTQ